MASFLSLERLWVAAALASVFALVSFTWVYPADFWWHLKVGELVASGQGLPRADPFSFTSQGQPYVFQMWLGGLVFYWLYSLGGLPLVVFFNALVFTLAYGLILWSCLKESSRTQGAVLSAIGGFALSIENWTVRPQTFSVLLFALFLSLLWRYYRGGESKALIPLPFLTALWANLHGAFLLGLALQALFLMGILLEKALANFFKATTPAFFLPPSTGRAPLWQPLAITTLLSALATLINPYGWGILGYLWSISTNQAIRAFMLEWAPTTTAFAPGRLFFLALAVTIILFVLLIRQRRTVALPNLILYLFFAWLALGAVRHILWFGMVIAPILTQQIDALAELSRRRATSTLANSPRDDPKRHVLPAILTATLIMALAIMSMPWLRPLLPLPEGRKALALPDTPFAVGEFLASLNAKGRILNDSQDGSYFIWRLYPGQRVFIDPRVELYPYELWAEYRKISQGLDYEKLFAKYGIDILVLHQERQGSLVAEAERSGDWQKLYSDNHHAVYARK